MGVDAEMFARIKGRENWLPDTEELKAAYELASTISYWHFSIMKGGEYDWAQYHALAIMRPIQDAADARDHGVMQSDIGRVVYTQDGPDIFAEPDEQFIRVHLAGRYYGEQYARGDWPTIRAVAEWLETRFPGCEVWYGGDSSGICAEHLSAARRDELNRFFLTSGCRTYERHADNGVDRFTGHKAPVCPCCNVALFSSGGGRGQSFWSCDGCGRRAVVTPLGKTLFGDRHADVFALAREAEGQAPATPAEGRA
jgi:hypothetical protein